jgi:hypothetical protein
VTANDIGELDGSSGNTLMGSSASAVVGAVESAGSALMRLAHRDPSLALQLARLVTVIAEEAARSGRLTRSLATALAATPDDEPKGGSQAARSRTGGAPHTSSATRTRSNRRSPGPWDPFVVFAEVGADGLRDRLTQLDLEQLRDIVAEHGMDADKLAMKWKDPSRVVERIVERVMSRSEKGSAFRSGD